jgi:formate hydrogenlyase transcriptional activator
MAPESAILSKKLEEQLQFEMLLTEISARFVNLPAEEVESEIQEGQRRICESLHFDRSTMWQIYDPTRSDAPLTHLFQYNDPDNPPIPERLAAAGSVPWLMKRIFRGEAVTISKMADLPPEAAADREFFRFYNTKSTAVIPLMAGGVLTGLMAFATVREERDWPESLVKRLQVVAQVFANAIARKRADQALRESEARLSLAADSAGAGLWILDFATGVFWLTEKARKSYGLASDEEMDFERFINLIHPDDRDRIRRATEKAKKSSVETQSEYRIVLPDGRVRWMVSFGRSYCASSSQPESLMGVSIDITARKETEISLQNAYEEIKQLKDRLEAENIYLRKSVASKNVYEHIIGQSAALREVLYKVEQVAPTDSVVLITGETGTGKELIAEAIHNLSKRKERLLVKVNCASLPVALIENELFGREKGAYTGALAKQVGRFELADNSTLFLDEVTELPLEVQAKLLRVLQNGEFERLGSPKTLRVNVRLVAATNRDMAEEVRKGAFRNDLYYRLNVFPVEVPPLRQRPEDISLLVDTFVREFSGKMGKRIRNIPKRTMEELQRYQWPGNIRELRNVIERGVIVSSGDTLRLTLPQGINDACSKAITTLAEAEQEHILGILKNTGWRIKGPHGAAAALGIKPSNLYAKMKRLGIPTRREKDNMLS